MADLTPIMLARFWSRVAVTSDFQCWPWQGKLGHKGYGRWQRTMAHRVAYELVNGSVPEGLLVRHRCDNPLCCNPGHLEAGTYKDNSTDCVTRGRIARGETHGMTRITEADAIYIRANPDKMKLRELAGKFGIALSTASYIRSGKSWKYLSEKAA